MPLRILPLLLLALALIVRCGPPHQEAREFAASTELKGAPFFAQLGPICGKGYITNHRSTAAWFAGDGWHVASNLYVSMGAQARSVTEAQDSSRRNVASFIECMFIAGVDQKLRTVHVTLDFTDFSNYSHPILLGKYAFNGSKLDELENWREEPSFFDRHRVYQFVDANMETQFEDWSQMKVE